MGLGIRPPKNCVFREVTINNASQKGLCNFKMANQLQTFHEGVKGIKTPVSIKNSKSIFPSKYPISAYMVTYVPSSRLCVHALALTHAVMFSLLAVRLLTLALLYDLYNCFLWYSCWQVCVLLACSRSPIMQFIYLLVHFPEQSLRKSACSDH